MMRILPCADSVIEPSTSAPATIRLRPIAYVLILIVRSSHGVQLTPDTTFPESGWAPEAPPFDRSRPERACYRAACPTTNVFSVTHSASFCELQCLPPL